MALYPNGSYLSRSPGRHFGGATAGVGGAGAGFAVRLRNRGDKMNRFLAETSSEFDSVPLGYGISGYVPAMKAGGMSAFNTAIVSLTTSGSAAAGLPGTGSVSFTIDFATATGGLISSGVGTASFAVTGTATILATRSGDGTASFSISTNTPQLGALGWVTATGAFSVTGSLTPYARGFMTGTTVDAGTLTTAAILAAMNAEPPAVNIKKVNDIVVNGVGTAGNPWGP